MQPTPNQEGEASRPMDAHSCTQTNGNMEAIHNAEIGNPTTETPDRQMNGNVQDSQLSQSGVFRFQSTQNSSISQHEALEAHGASNQMSPNLFASPQQRGPENSSEGSQSRKRSRVQKTAQAKEKPVENSFFSGNALRVEEQLKQMQAIFNTVMSKCDKSISATVIQMSLETLKNVNMEFALCLATVSNLSDKLLNAQDERNALQQQVIELQAALVQQTGPVQARSNSYLAAAMKNVSKDVAKGRQLPIPSTPTNARHAPAERVIIFKVKEKGEQATKAQQEVFRENIKKVLGVAAMQGIEVIRPTRVGGHTIIFSSEGERDKALRKLRANEKSKGITEEMSGVIAPKKQVSKAYCKVPPEGLNSNEILQEMYNKNNPHLHTVPANKREAKIIVSKTLGWIFELSYAEAAALNAQGGRIRYGCGHEINVEEFIPLQQCYKCCAFGHNAAECSTEVELCRLCAAIGHAGKDCPHRDDKIKWKCINCQILNEKKGYNLPTMHAAAQLHKCPYALHQKMQKKVQMIAAGIYTTPILGETLIQSKERTTNIAEKNMNNGTQANKKQNVNHSKSRSRSRVSKAGNVNNKTKKWLNGTNISISSSSSSSSSETDKGRSQGNRWGTNNMEMSSAPMGSQTRPSQIMRPPRTRRPISVDGWTTIERRTSGSGKEGEMRGRNVESPKEGTNSTSSLKDIVRRNNGMDVDDHTG